jgi:soluble lytic murein transglycosylase-like protein
MREIYKARIRELRPILIAIAVIVVAMVVVTLFRTTADVRRERELVEMAQQAPPDLAAHRDDFLAGIAAIGRNDAGEAIRRLGSFSFAPRAVEEYRLYYLANAHQLAGDMAEARRSLGQLWLSDSRLAYREDAGFNLGNLYEETLSWPEAASVYGMIAARAEQPNVAAAAHWEYIQARLYSGDPVAALLAARRIVVHAPKSPQAADAISLIRAVGSISPTAALALTPQERLDRAGNLIRDNDPQSALDDLAALSGVPLPPQLQQRQQLIRGMALHHLRRYDDSEEVLAPLFSAQLEIAVPALRYSVLNNRSLAASISTTTTRTVTEKKRVGTRTVKRKGKTVKEPQYRTERRTVTSVDSAAAARRDAAERRQSERLRALLGHPIEPDLRREVLTRLIELAEEKDQNAYLRELVPQLIRLDRIADPALQRFWDAGWAAYARADYDTAQQHFDFIRSTYTNPAIRRQATYWFARTIERRGRKSEAQALYQQLMNAPFEDIYMQFASERGGTRGDVPRVNLATAPDWHTMAEAEVPAELRLAYELTALGAYRDARLEIQRNTSNANRRWVDALLGEIYYVQGSQQVAYRYFRRAFPELSSAEQHTVPRQFLQMYYPVRYDETIIREARRRELDPYLVMALIHQESAFNPEARSPVGASGLMQLMPATAREVGDKLRKPLSDLRVNDPDLNIELGTFYLRQILGWTNGNVHLALAAYNGGIGNVRRWQRAGAGRAHDELIEGIPFSETRTYVKRITLIRSTYEHLYEDLKNPERLQVETVAAAPAVAQ